MEIMSEPARTGPTHRRRLPDGPEPRWTTVAAIDCVGGVVAGSAVMAGFWALGRWGLTWLTSYLDGPRTAFPPFVLGATNAALVAATVGIGAALTLGREMLTGRGRHHL